jgi:hypothetical protein
MEIGFAAFILISPGCAASHQPATSGLAPVAPDAVQVFVDHAPDRPYVSVGRFTVDGDDRATLAEARRGAAAIGANAIVVTPLPASLNGSRFMSRKDATGGGVEVRSDARPALDVLAVVWTCGQP